MSLSLSSSSSSPLIDEALEEFEELRDEALTLSAGEFSLSDVDDEEVDDGDDLLSEEPRVITDDLDDELLLLLLLPRLLLKFPLLACTAASFELFVSDKRQPKAALTPNMLPLSYGALSGPILTWFGAATSKSSI